MQAGSSCGAINPSPCWTLLLSITPHAAIRTLHIPPHSALSLHLLLYTYRGGQGQSDFFITSNQLTCLLNWNSGENFGSSLKMAKNQKDMFPSAGGGQGLGGPGPDWQGYLKSRKFSKSQRVRAETSSPGLQKWWWKCWGKGNKPAAVGERQGAAA